MAFRDQLFAFKEAAHAADVPEPVLLTWLSNGDLEPFHNNSKIFSAYALGLLGLCAQAHVHGVPPSLAAYRFQSLAGPALGLILDSERVKVTYSEALLLGIQNDGADWTVDYARAIRSPSFVAINVMACWARTFRRQREADTATRDRRPVPHGSDPTDDLCQVLGFQIE